MMKNIKIILAINVAALALFLSFYFNQYNGFWFELNSNIFFYFNKIIGESSEFVKFLAYTNNRAFDVIAFLAMGFLFLYHFVKQDAQGMRRMFAIGLLMLLTAVLIKLMGRFIPVDNASPTLYFKGINRLSELSSIPTKDASSDSFPGDHGMMLMIFAAFMWRYFGLRTFLIASIIVIVFSMPRIAAGAHWFTDVYVGSLSIASFCLSWLLLTPASEWCVDKIVQLYPKRFR